MDPLTHTLVGACLAETGLGRSTRRGRAALIVGANLPDVDALSYFAGADVALGLRRGWTHGPLALLVLPVLLTALLVAIDRRGRRESDASRASPASLLVLSMLATLTHPALDWLNTYGIRLLMPFEDRWFYGDAVFIVDPWLWLVLGGGVALARSRAGRTERAVSWTLLVLAGLLMLRSALVPTPAAIVWCSVAAGVVGAAYLLRGRPADRRPAVVALLLGGAYIGGMIASSRAIAGWVQAELSRRGVAAIHELMIGPAPADPFRRDVVARTAEAYVTGSFDWHGRPRLELDSRNLPRPPDSALVEAAFAAPSVRGFVEWMRFPFVEIDASEAGYTVWLLDARYVRRRTRGFGSARVRLDRELTPLD